jgi:hypothetical protein
LADLPLEAPSRRGRAGRGGQNGLLAFASATGVVMRQMMAAELTAVIGEKRAKIPTPERVGNWHGDTEGEGRLHDQALGRRQHARSRTLVPTRMWSQGHGQVGRRALGREVTPAVVAPAEYDQASA